MLPAKGELQAPSSTWTCARLTEGVRVRGRDYLHLTKARLSVMVVMSSIVGYWLAATDVQLSQLMAFTLGTFLVVAGANAFNQVIEREPDARMARTARRPLPTGRLAVAEATVAASLMAAAGAGILFQQGGGVCGGLAVTALLVYVLVYTPMKARSAWSTLPGAVAGAIPPLMGWSAASGELGPLAWCLFAILFFWQFPHTGAIAATYREDYERVGYHALPLGASGRQTRIHTAIAVTALLAVSLLPALVGLAGPTYLGGAVVLGGLLGFASIRFGDGTSKRRAAQLIAASLFYLPLLLALLVIDAKIS